MLMAKRSHLFWSPCAAHCIDLMLEDIGNIPPIAGTLQSGMAVVSYIYKHVPLINMLKAHTNKKNLLRPGKTRIAASYLTLQRIQQLKHNLRTMFTSEKWATCNYAKELEGRRVQDIIMMVSFWSGVAYVLKLMGPLVKVLRLVENEKKPVVGYIYEAMDRAKEVIQKTFDGDESKYKNVFAIIDKRWEEQLQQPLHLPGTF